MVRENSRQGSNYEACYFGGFISLVCRLLKLIHYLMVVHAKMPVCTISINQRSKSGIDHQNNQPTFLIEKIILIFCPRSPIS
jgi:hypothetical protein